MKKVKAKAIAVICTFLSVFGVLAGMTVLYSIDLYQIYADNLRTQVILEGSSYFSEIGSNSTYVLTKVMKSSATIKGAALYKGVTMTSSVGNFTYMDTPPEPTINDTFYLVRSDKNFEYVFFDVEDSTVGLALDKAVIGFAVTPQKVRGYYIGIIFALLVIGFAAILIVCVRKDGAFYRSALTAIAGSAALLMVLFCVLTQTLQISEVSNQLAKQTTQRAAEIMQTEKQMQSDASGGANSWITENAPRIAQISSVTEGQFSNTVVTVSANYISSFIYTYAFKAIVAAIVVLGAVILLFTIQLRKGKQTE